MREAANLSADISTYDLKYFSNKSFAVITSTFCPIVFGTYEFIIFCNFAWSKRFDCSARVLRATVKVSLRIFSGSMGMLVFEKPSSSSNNLFQHSFGSRDFPLPKP